MAVGNTAEPGGSGRDAGRVRGRRSSRLSCPHDNVALVVGYTRANLPLLTWSSVKQPFGVAVGDVGRAEDAAGGEVVDVVPEHPDERQAGEPVASAGR